MIVGNLPEDLQQLIIQYQELMQAALKSSASGSAAPDPISLRASEIRTLIALRGFGRRFPKAWYVPEINRRNSLLVFEGLIRFGFVKSDHINLRTKKSNWFGRIFLSVLIRFWCKDGIMHQYRITENGLAWLETRKL